MRRALLLLLVLVLPVGLTACKEDLRSKRLDALNKQIEHDRDLLEREAETADPSRKGLTASFRESSIMSLRETVNPKRPWVAYVRIRFHFAKADGSELGDSVWDYIYALDPSEHWIKADEPDPGTAPHVIPSPVVVPSGGKPA